MIELVLTQGVGAGFPVAAAILAFGLAAVHLVTGRWEFATRDRRRQFLSAGGGVSVAYVFVLMLPEVSEAALVGEHLAEGLFAEQLIFVVALSGFVVYYGVEVFVSQQLGEDVEESRTVYRAHLLSFTLYSAVIGYLLFHQEVETVSNLVFYAVAMALHFGITDYGLHRHYGPDFDSVGRTVLSVGTLFGAVVGFSTEIRVLTLNLLSAFVAGAIVFNVIKEELPALTQSRFAAFVLGALSFVVLLLFT